MGDVLRIGDFRGVGCVYVPVYIEITTMTMTDLSLLSIFTSITMQSPFMASDVQHPSLSHVNGNISREKQKVKGGDGNGVRCWGR